MTVVIERDVQRLGDEIARLIKLTKNLEQQTFWFAGNSALVTFTLPKGWEPVNVYVDGGLMRPGTGEDYIASYDGFVHSVTLSVAPAVAPAVVDIGIIAKRSV
jgi:hypothetical protein